MKKILILLFGLSCAGFSQVENYIQYLPSSSDGIVNHHSYYSYSFMKDNQFSEWTIYFSTKDYIENDTIKRSNYFKKDPNLGLECLSSDEYKGSGHDRGHLIPAADMSFSKKAMRESFYYPNIAPQQPCFNRGSWKKLEKQVRDLVVEYDSLIIITGCVFKDSVNHENAYNNNLPIPDLYYKIIIDVERKASLAFLMPNYCPQLNYELMDYVCSINTLEELTGLDFFYKLPDELELEFENQY